MALDRTSIEKRDFPIGRRGYEPDAVDEHLAMLADEVDALRRSASRPTRSESLATAASEQVRLIVEAAERTAEEIRRDAELEADRIRGEAREAAELARSEAGSPGAEAERISGSASTLLERADAVESELGALLEFLRDSATRLGQEHEALQATIGTLHDDAGVASAVAEPAVIPPAPHIPAYESGMLPGAPEFAEDPVDDGAPSGDEEGARLIALNMALNGTPREETERYLADSFELADIDALLDDVYARAGQ